MSSKDFGLGPKWWQRPGNKLAKCAERKSDWCDPAETDGCCAIIPCTYCLGWHVYGEGIQYGESNFSTNSWTGTIAGATWVGYWERNYYTNECEFIVTLNGDEIYRKSCYEGQSCRDSSDEAAATIGYDEGTIVWKKYESRPLSYIKDPDTNCRTYFCGNCDCSCECLCVTITEPDDTVTKGEICDVSYPCDGPLWDGTIGYYDLSLALGRDEYGECIITATVDGQEQAPVIVSGCSDMSATIVLYGGTTIAIRCKKCSCDEDFPCCPGMTFPETLHLTLLNMNLKCPCFNGQVVTLHRVAGYVGGAAYISIWPVPCATVGLCVPDGQQVWYKWKTACTVDDAFPRVEAQFICGGATAPAVDDPNWSSIYNFDIIGAIPHGCDPFFFQYTGDPNGNGIFAACDGDDPTITTDQANINLQLTL